MKPHILLRSLWQTVNIGDIGHTPGMIALRKEYVPEARLTLWPFDVGNGVRAMLLKEFSELDIVTARQGVDAPPDAPDVITAWNDADFFLHGSGPQVLAQHDLRQKQNRARPLA